MGKKKAGASKNLGGRPLKEINWEFLDSLLHVGANMLECAEELKISDKTLREAIKRKFDDESFEDYRDRKLSKQRLSLKRAILDKANSGDNTMMIWASKNLLGWSDQVETRNKHEHKVEEVYEAEWGQQRASVPKTDVDID